MRRGSKPTDRLRAFVTRLSECYQGLAAGGALGAGEPSAVDQRLTELLLAEAALRHADAQAPGRPPQVAVLGPTQTGKSTIVNLLLGAPLAAVSPLAGFTVHAQGFWIGADESDDRWTAELFPGWQRCEPAALSRNRLDCYALTIVARGRPRTGAPGSANVPTGQTGESAAPLFEQADIPAEPPAGLPPCVVWDTPDFDTLAAGVYRRGVLEVAALADVHVFVLSKEKYSDLSVWRLLRLLRPLSRPLVICLNKLPPEAVETVTASLRERVQALGNHEVPIVSFEYQPGADALAALAALPEVWELRDRLAEGVQAAWGRDRGSGLVAFLREHWADWTAPLAAELAARRAWEQEVGAALGEALESYRRDFLDHPLRFDTFRRATAELLHLLELPGVAGVLGRVRQVLSWPARRLLTAGRSWSARHKGGAVPRGPGSEEVVLGQIVEKLLTRLEREAARRSDPATPGHAVWRALACRLEQHEARLRETFQAAARRQRDQFAPEIQRAANQLYERLQDNPALLNTLRAARATTELGLIALAVKTGGLGVNDLVFAPAMFAVTSLLTEGALGSYMGHIAGELKKRQLAHVRQELIEGVFARELHALAADLRGAGLFGFERAELDAATQALENWQPRAAGSCD